VHPPQAQHDKLSRRNGWCAFLISRYKRVTGDTLRSRGHPQRNTEARTAVKALNCMNEPGWPNSVRVA
jgi:hypothetical protein